MLAIILFYLLMKKIIQLVNVLQQPFRKSTNYNNLLIFVSVVILVVVRCNGDIERLFLLQKAYTCIIGATNLVHLSCHLSKKSGHHTDVHKHVVIA